MTHVLFSCQQLVQPSPTNVILQAINRRSYTTPLKLHMYLDVFTTLLC